MPKGQGYDLPVQRFRAEQEEWKLFGENTARQGTTRSKTLRAFMAWFNREKGATMPQRPPLEPPSKEE